MAFQSIVQLLLLLLVVLAVLTTHAQNPPKLFEISSGKFELTKQQLEQDPKDLVQHVLEKLRMRQSPQQRELDQSRLGRTQFTLHNDLGKEVPEKGSADQERLGKAGLVEIASGSIQLDHQEIQQVGSNHAQLVQHVLGRLKTDQKQKLEQQKLEQQKLEQEKFEQQKLEQEKLEQQKLEQQKLEQQKFEQQKFGLQKLEQQKLELQKLEQQQLDEQELAELQFSEQQLGPKQKPNQFQQQQLLQPGNNKRPQANKLKPATGQQRLFTSNIPDLGRVRGRLGVSQWTGKRIMQFFDIPYGQSPVGELRFKPSLPVKPWSGVLKANKPHPGCPSLQNLDVFLNLSRRKIDVENCLRLSVNTKKLNGSAPVMVYIHGDFLYDGNSLEATPGYMLEEDVVLVSVRYRLGPFGFLSTMSEQIPGNAAVHDVILALQWIQKHITHFGGDPKRVTLFGQVGGAAMINILSMSPAVPLNLFHRVILQSGSALSPAFVTENPMPAVREIAKIGGCKSVDIIEDLNKCLLAMNTTQLLEAFNEHGDKNVLQGIGSYGGAQFVVGGPSGVLPENPGKLMADENYKAYPTMGGSVKNAGSFILKDIFIDNFNESIPDSIFNGNGYIDYIINQTNGVDPADAWKKYATEEIFSADDIKNGSFHKMLPGLIDMCSTIAFKNPVLLALKANAKKLPNNTYLYSFDYAGERNRYETLEDDPLDMPFDLGVSLTDENLYLFPWPLYNLISSNRDFKIAKRMVALWVSFAATGVPQAPGMPAWPAMNDETGPYVKIGTTVSIAENYLDEYTVTVKEAQMGYNLLNDVFFEIFRNIDEAIPEVVDDNTDTVEDVLMHSV